MRPYYLLSIGAAACVLAACTSSATFTTPSSTRATAPPSAGPTAPSTPPTPEPTPTPTPTPSPTKTKKAKKQARPVITPIGNAQWDRMLAAGVWRPGCPAGREDLRRLDINYVNFNGKIDRGSLIANQDVVEDLAEIFTVLFRKKFPIAQLQPVENFGGDVVVSLEANNTSAFNCRRPDQINAPVTDSPHANGRAIDINPYQNPWTDPRCRCWVPSGDFATVRIGPGVITEGSLPWDLFTERGWIWQDIKVPDYMHFDTGFPSRPWPESIEEREAQTQARRDHMH